MKIQTILLSLFIVLGCSTNVLAIRKTGKKVPQSNSEYCHVSRYPFERFALFSKCFSFSNEDGYQQKNEYHWRNIFFTMAIPVSIYAYAKNYTWVNNQFWNLFKR